MTEHNDRKNDPLDGRVDPTLDDATNLRDDGSMEPRDIEEEQPESERPDTHKGVTLGQVDPRMSKAAAEFESEHEEAKAHRKNPDGSTGNPE